MSDYVDCTICGAPVLKVAAHRFVFHGGKQFGTYCSVACCPRCEA